LRDTSSSRTWTCSKPKRPLMQRLPRVTCWSSGLETLTMIALAQRIRRPISSTP
jgi:hypothetical protein